MFSFLGLLRFVWSECLSLFVSREDQENSLNTPGDPLLYTCCFICLSATTVQSEKKGILLENTRVHLSQVEKHFMLEQIVFAVTRFQIIEISLE